jgi:hypothetical protein
MASTDFKRCGCGHVHKVRTSCEKCAERARATRAANILKGYVWDYDYAKGDRIKLEVFDTKPNDSCEGAKLGDVFIPFDVWEKNGTDFTGFLCTFDVSCTPARLLKKEMP